MWKAEKAFLINGFFCLKKDINVLISLYLYILIKYDCMENIASAKVSRIVANNYKTAQVFTTYGIDFCCNGGVPLEQACRQQSVDLQQVIKELNEAIAIPEVENFAEMPLGELISYIEKVHHTYVRNALPTLTVYLTKLCRVHGERHPELFELKELFDQSSHDLMQHMSKEEEVLFPYIQALEASIRGQFLLDPPRFGHLQNPIVMLESEHEQEGSRFKLMDSLTNGFVPPKDACQTYRVAFAKLQEFEMDLHKHIHLENNILFPKALEMFETTFS